MLRFLISCILLLTLGHPTSASDYNPSLPWQTTQSEHFRIIYLPDYAPIVSANLGYFEQQAASINQMLGSSFPAEKINLILNPHTDQANGFASSFVRYTIQINLVYPQFMALSFDDAIRFIFTHEYVHIQQIRGPMNWWDDLTKKLVALNPEYLLQSYALEGLAVMYESLLDRGGRAHSGDYQKYIRIDALARTLPDESTLANPFVHRAPGPIAKYIYSSAFFEYLRTTYGIEKLHALTRELIHHYAFRDAFKTIYLYDLTIEIQRWHEYEYQRARDHLTSTPAQVYPTTFNDPGNKKNLRYLDPTHLLYLDTTFTDHPRPQLFTYDLASRKKTLTLDDAGEEFNLNHAGTQLVLTRYTWENRYDYLSSFYLYDLPTKTLTKIDPIRHALNPSFGADDHSLLYVRYENMVGNLYRYDLIRHQETKLTDNDSYRITYRDPIELPNGDIMTIRYEAGQGSSLLAFSIRNPGWKTQLIPARYGLTLNDLYPDSAQDMIFFCANQHETTNLYGFELYSGTVQQLTHTLGGATDPVRIDQRLYFLDYHSGADIIASCTPNAVPLAALPRLAPAPPDTQPSTFISNAYHPLALLNADVIGSRIYAQDPLLQHQLQLGLELQSEGTDPTLMLNYQNSQLGPTLALGNGLHPDRHTLSLGLSDRLPTVFSPEITLGWQASLSSTDYSQRGHRPTLYQKLGVYLSTLKTTAFNFFTDCGEDITYTNYFEKFTQNHIHRISAEGYWPFQPFTLHGKIDGYQADQTTWFSDYSLHGYQNQIAAQEPALTRFIQGTLELRQTVLKTSRDIWIGNLAGLSHKGFAQLSRISGQTLACWGYAFGAHVYFFNYVPLTLSYAIELPQHTYRGLAPKASAIINVGSTF